MSNKKLILSNLFAFGFGCIVIGHVVWNVIHYWGGWRSWTFGALGVLNVTTLVFMVRSYLRWFDSHVAAAYHRGRLEAAREIWWRLRKESDMAIEEDCANE